MPTLKRPLVDPESQVYHHERPPGLLPLNPYVAGKSLSGDHGFFGRQDIFELVQTELARNAIVLFGQRRIGKTSILKQLQRRLREPFIPVYFDLMDRAEQPMGQLLTDLAQLMTQGAALPDWSSPMDDAGDEFRQRFLPTLYASLRSERSMVLLLDEFDVLDRSAEQQLSPSAAARAFFPYLRRLIETERRLHFLVVIGRKTEELSSDFKATFKAAKFKRVSVLSAEDSRELVTLAERNGSLRFEPGVVDTLLALTTGHPYLTQLVCQQLWDAAHSGGGEPVPLVSAALLDKVVPRALEAGQNVFEWIWDGLPPAERVVLAAIAEATAQQAAVTEEQVLELLQRHGVRVLSGDLDLAPRKLVDWELLRVVHGGYCCHVELIRRWVVSQKPLLRVKDEVYRLNPLAERLFLSARDFYALNQPVKTQDHLVEVLQINPGHLPARLLLARLLHERGQHAQAVKELETAWLYDEAAARMPLVGALLAAAEAHERRGERQPAIQCYERALTLSPSERIAAERLLRLRIAQASAAIEAADYKAALEQLLLMDTLEEKPRTKQSDLGREIARRSEMTEDWDTALRAYHWLQKRAPEDHSEAAVERVVKQRELDTLYREAIDAMERQAWGQAIAAFARVVARSPAHRDAARQLALAVDKQKAPRQAGEPDRSQATSVIGLQRPSTKLQSHWKSIVVWVALLLAFFVGAGAVRWLMDPIFKRRVASRSPAPSVMMSFDAEASQLLSEADNDLRNMRWEVASAKSNRVLKGPAVSDWIRERASILRARGTYESQVQPIYDRFVSSGENYDQALELYRKIPIDSSYHNRARENYDKLVPLFVEKHIKAAKKARAKGKCDDFRNEIKVVLDVDPKQINALHASDLTCGEKGMPTSRGPLVAVAPHELEQGLRDPFKIETPRTEQAETHATTGKPPSKADWAEAEAVLSRAQTEYVNGNFNQAISEAKSVQRINPTRAHRIIGAAACNMKDIKLANEAFRHLDTAARQYLIYSCQRQGITNSGSQFKLAE